MRQRKPKPVMQVRPMQGYDAPAGEASGRAARHQGVQAQLQQEEQGAWDETERQGRTHVPVVQEQEQGKVASPLSEHALAEPFWCMQPLMNSTVSGMCCKECTCCAWAASLRLALSVSVLKHTCRVLLLAR